MASTPQRPATDPRHPATPPAQRPNQPAHSATPGQRPHEDASRPRTDPSTGRDPSQPSGLDPSYNTKPEDQGGGDQSPHPSPATDPTNAPPEPAQWTKDNPRPPLPKGRDYVAGQPVTQEEYELTEKEQAERVRPEAWKRLEGQGVEIEEGMKDATSGWNEEEVKRARESEAKARQARDDREREASVGWDRDKEGTRPDARALRDPDKRDDDVNKAPGGSGGQGTRADGRARSPDTEGEGPNSRAEGVDQSNPHTRPGYGQRSHEDL